VEKDVQVVLQLETCFIEVVAEREYGCVVGVGPIKVWSEVGMSAVNIV